MRSVAGDRERALWDSDVKAEWQAALDSYDSVIERQGVTKLPELDAWFRGELPLRIAARRVPHVTHEELARLTEWKMARGVWRARNVVLVRGNAPEDVVRTSERALSMVPDPKRPIRELATLAGVGPATASAVAAAVEPRVYPFFDDLVAGQIPGLGDVAYTLAYYARYSQALRDRADRLGPDWPVSSVEQALWAHIGGKAGTRGGDSRPRAARLSGERIRQ